MLVWWLVPLAGSILLAVLCHALWLRDPTITKENRLIENGQVLFLALAALAHAGQRWRSHSTVAQFSHLALALLCLSMIVREVDIEKIGVARTWEAIEWGVRAIVVVAWLALASRVLRHFTPFWNVRLAILGTTNSLMTAAGILLYSASWFFDKNIIPLDPDPSQFVEETLQLAATLFFFAAAWKPINLAVAEVLRTTVGPWAGNGPSTVRDSIQRVS